MSPRQSSFGTGYYRRYYESPRTRVADPESCASLAGFVFAWWERDNFNTDAIHYHPNSTDETYILRRNDNLYEFGGGLVWEFVKTWSLRPEILYIRDQSNTTGFNYSSTEVWINIRKAF